MGLLGAYDSDDSGAESQDACSAAASQATVASAAPAPAPLQRSPPAKAAEKPRASASATAPLDGPGGRHCPSCDCDDCESLMARFVAKNVQTKGIRFKCKLCGELVARKADAAGHIQSSHSSDLQVFKQQKQPKIFEAPKRSAPAAKKFSFAREDVLGRKRHIADDDAEVDFGGFAKKEKPEPPPCMMEGYVDLHACNEVFTAPPWAGKDVPLANDSEATDTEKVVDQHVVNAQAKRFTSRNVLEVKRDIVRCKLCYKTFKNVAETEKHIITDHGTEFAKEQEIWHRFLHSMAKRQPPFGWVCKICNLFFPSDNSTFRHLGKEVYIRREERHADLWKEKEDRWGHEADQECCGDGMSVAGGLSYESVLAFKAADEKEEAREKKALDAAAAAAAGCGPGDQEDSSSDSDEAAAAGKKKMIKEF